jgi:hypothetical protein
MPYSPLIQALRNPGMRERHWLQVSEKLGFEFVMDESLTFTKCLELRLQDHIDAIVKVGEFAAKEFQIEEALNDMERQWVRDCKRPRCSRGEGALSDIVDMRWPHFVWVVRHCRVGGWSGLVGWHGGRFWRPYGPPQHASSPSRHSNQIPRCGLHGSLTVRLAWFAHRPTSTWI